MKRLEHWKDYNKGQTVLVIGNGPSVLQHKERLKLNILPSISMNRGYEICEGDYYVTLMNTFYMDKVKNTNYGCVFMCGSYTEIPQQVRWNFKPQLTCIPRLTKYDTPPSDPLDISKGWKVSHTGVLALYLAAWLGFDTAILVGYDGHGRHFMPRVLADDHPNHKQHIIEMNAFMQLDHGMKIYNTCYTNGYGHNYMPLEELL